MVLCTLSFEYGIADIFHTVPIVSTATVRPRKLKADRRPEARHILGVSSMPFALTVLIGAQLAGEVIHRLLHLPLPGPVIGMFILALALVTRAQSWLTPTASCSSDLHKTATVLISNMGLLFVPAGVGIIAELNILQREWLPIVTGLLVSTVLGLVVTGVVMHRITRRAQIDAVPSISASHQEGIP
jgi:holin-like protein